MEQKEKGSYEENNEIYEADNGEISFKGVWTFLKKSFIRLVIYLLIAVALVTAIVLGVKFFARTDYSVAATIEFTYAGIASGKNPDGSAFDKETVRSVNYVNTALINAGLDETIVAGGYDIDSVRTRVSVNGVMPDAYVQKYNELVAGGMSSADAYAQLAQMTFYPTKFVVSMRNFEGMGLKKHDAVKFLDELILAYTDGFLMKYSQSVVFSDSVFASESDLYDYLDYYDIYSVRYAELENYLARMASVNSTVFDSGRSFASLRSDVSFLNTQLSALKAFVTEKNISNDIESLKLSVKDQLDDLKKEQTRLDTIIEAVEKQLKDIQPNTTTIVPGGNDQTIIQVEYPQAYYDLQKQLTGYYEQRATVLTEVADKQEIYDAVKDKTQADVAEADKVRADTILATLRATSKQFIADVNKTSAEYTQKTVTENSLRTVSPSAYSSETASFPTMLSYLVGVLIAIAAAMIVTAVKVKAAEKKKEALQNRLKAQPKADNE